MFSKAEMQQMKREFWIEFAERYPRKWLLYDTKIKDFAFKFDADNKKAQVILEVSHRDPAKRHAYFEKLQSLRTILRENYLPDAAFESDHVHETGKTVSRILVQLDGAGISNRASWPQIFDFFHDKMSAFELFFYESEDYIKDI